MLRVICFAFVIYDFTPVGSRSYVPVIVLLRGVDYSSVGKKDRQKPSLRRTYSEEIMDFEEYNSTKYLLDLSRHKQLALGSS
ncbi:hypothetical protein RJ641_023592 [Dillenia turbinata]|uniref:Uncharacterized protein n=1 Tax=Dillenia turbinata TaxID=194707 RepID=A0AAN8UCN0_9MAGN